MTTPDTNPFQIIEDAGLSQGEFARMCRVTRCTVNLWVNGRMKPHRYLQPQVDAAIESLQKGLQTGRLPLTGTFRGKARAEKLLAILDAVN